MISYHRRYQENTTLLNLLKYIFDILMVILTAYVLVSFSCTRTTILGGSMEPSINNDDTVLVNKFAYAIKGPKRFDCIAFEPDSIGSSKLYVKRVILEKLSRLKKDTFILMENYLRMILLIHIL